MSFASKDFPSYAHVQRAKELADLAAEFSKMAAEGGDLRADPRWDDFEHLRPTQAQSLLVRRAEAVKRNSLLDMISECTAPLKPEEGWSVAQVRTNKLLAAILLKLHGIE